MNVGNLQFIKELKKRIDVLGIVMFGSRARGNNRLDSDIDLLVLTKRGFSQVLEIKSRQAFEIVYTNPSKTLRYWQKKPDSCAEFWSHAKILYDKDAVVNKLQQKANEIIVRGKPKLNSVLLKRKTFHYLYQSRAIKSILKSDPVSAALLLDDEVRAVVEDFFHLNQIWLPGPKRRIREIEVRDKQLFKLLKNYFLGGYSLSGRFEIYTKIVNHICPTAEIWTRAKSTPSTRATATLQSVWQYYLKMFKSF